MEAEQAADADTSGAERQAQAGERILAAQQPQAERQGEGDGKAQRREQERRTWPLAPVSQASVAHSRIAPPPTGWRRGARSAFSRDVLPLRSPSAPSR